MTEEKQIVGMARILAQTYRYPCEETCEDCKPKDARCLAQEAAKNLQKAGFGASEVKAHWIERKVRMWAKGGKPYFGYEQECSHCGCINKSKKGGAVNFALSVEQKCRKKINQMYNIIFLIVSFIVLKILICFVRCMR